jgi:hypothetical protein
LGKNKTMLLKTEGAGYRSADLTLTFGPGVVRYLNPLSLVADAGRLALAEIESFGVAPSVKFTTWDSSPYDLGIKSDQFWNANFKYHEFPSLFEERPHEELIREVAFIFKCYSEAPFPTEAYWAFAQYTESSRLVLSEFLESWMRETFKNHDLAQSYADSAAHLMLNVGYNSSYVFRKTEYLIERRKEIAAAAEELVLIQEEIKSEEIARTFDEAIRKSSLEVFTYLMEDTRNGLIKIGKSKNPERREKTLQSEAPSVEMRIAVPTESDFESELHGEFSHLRQRGEWFKLSSMEIKTVIERLLAHGDPDRAITSHEWIGRVFLAAFSSEARRLTKTQK